MNKYVFTALLLFAGFRLSYGQGPPADYKKSLEFLQGNGVYEDGMMSFLAGMKDSIWTHFDLFINDAKALAAISMIFFFAIKSYEMISGDKQLEVMPLLRPFGLTMVIIWWGGFVKMVAFPTDLVAMETEQMFASEQTTVNNLPYDRAEYMVKVANALYSFQAESEVAEKESDTWYGEAWDSVTSTVKEGISTVVTPLIESASILPAFRDSFSTWVARFISVNLYSGIGYWRYTWNRIRIAVKRYVPLMNGSFRFQAVHLKIPISK